MCLVLSGGGARGVAHIGVLKVLEELRVPVHCIVPGVFAPAELEGRLLADDGLVRNLGVDVARQFNPDVLIAVNLGTGLMKREELRSVFGVGAQVINILTEQNVRISLAELKPADILILPELGDFSSADFANAHRTIAIGERAAGALSDRLQNLAVTENEYATYLAQLRVERETPRFDRVRLDTAALQRVNPRVVEATFKAATGDDHSDPGIARGLTALLASDDFQQVRYRVDDEDGSRLLTIVPREKSWGPNYMRFGLELSTDFDGESAFTLLADHKMTWLNSRGLEWRNRITLGDLTGVATELYQPLDQDSSVLWSGALFWLPIQSWGRSIWALDSRSQVTRRRTCFSGGLERRERARAAPSL